MTNRFFTPFVGDNYRQGINGKKVLVLGASFYCNRVECPMFAQCTDVQRKDSSAFNTTCPYYSAAGQRLEDEPTYCVEEGPQTYHRFTTVMGRYLGTNDYDAVWSHMAFTNYVQFFLPADPDNFRDTRKTDLSERDFLAFCETLRELQPDIVIVWGGVINSRLKEQNPYLVSADRLRDTDYYICELNVPGVAHRVTLINPYHPSSSAWNADIDTFDRYMRSIL